MGVRVLVSSPEWPMRPTREVVCSLSHDRVGGGRSCALAGRVWRVCDQDGHERRVLGNDQSISAREPEQSYVGLIDRVSPEVVQISNPQGLGSGVVLDSNGDVATNAHVVSTGGPLTVSDSRGHAYPATLVGSFTPDDLAVVRAHGASLPAATFANSGTAQVGDIVLAIGNPLGLRSSVTDGIISALDPDGRRRLLALYGAGVDLRLADADAVLARTEGVTASFIKELVRKSALVAAQTDNGDGRLTVTDEHVAQAVDMLLDEGAGLTRALLGITRDPSEDDVPPESPPSAAG
jgi:hypothetical protein